MTPVRLHMGLYGLTRNVVTNDGQFVGRAFAGYFDAGTQKWLLAVRLNSGIECHSSCEDRYGQFFLQKGRAPWLDALESELAAKHTALEAEQAAKREAIEASQKKAKRTYAKRYHALQEYSDIECGAACITLPREFQEGLSSDLEGININWI